MQVQKGDKTEAKVLAEMVNRGIGVSLPFTSDSPYDMIIDRDGKLERVQIKSGHMRNGCVRFNAYSWNHQCSTKKVTYEDTVDSFIVYCPENDTMYYIPIDEVTTTNKMSLRVEEPKVSMSTINWAHDFELTMRFQT